MWISLRASGTLYMSDITAFTKNGIPTIIATLALISILSLVVREDMLIFFVYI